MKNISQKQAVKFHLEKGKSITPLQALMLFSCFRLASVVNRLKSEGMDIVCNIYTDYSEQGNTKRYAVYHKRSCV
jgi:hypothetical protein